MDSKQYNYQETRDSVKTMNIHVDMWHLLTLCGPAIKLCLFQCYLPSYRLYLRKVILSYFKENLRIKKQTNKTGFQLFFFGCFGRIEKKSQAYVSKVSK